MKRIYLILVVLGMVFTSCTKPEDQTNYAKNSVELPTVYYEGDVSPICVKYENDNVGGSTYDTYSYNSWREMYQDDGLPVYTGGFDNDLQGTTWVIKSFYVTGHIFIQPNDTIEFIDNSHYILNGSINETYGLIPNINGISFTLRFSNIPSFGGTGWFAGIIPWHTIDNALLHTPSTFIIFKLYDENNTNYFVRTVKFIKIA